MNVSEESLLVVYQNTEKYELVHNYWDSECTKVNKRASWYTYFYMESVPKEQKLIVGTQICDDIVYQVEENTSLVHKYRDAVCTK